MEHLALEIFDLDGAETKYAFLSEDAAITITEMSEIFASGDIWSHSFKLNTVANSHIFGSSGDLHGSRLHEQIHKRRTRLWVESLPFRLGVLKLDDEAEVDENGDIEVGFESGNNTFEDMLDGMNARDVPMLGDHLLGIALWRKRNTKATVKYKITGKVRTKNTEQLLSDATGEEMSYDLDTADSYGHNAEWPKYVISHGEFYNILTGKEDVIGGVGMYGESQPTTLNTDDQYDDNAPLSHPYCNLWIAYQHHYYEAGSDTPTTERSYDISSERRVNSAPSFYVMYWLRALMTHLGIQIEENQMQDVQDLRRLFMLNTLCAYEEPEELNTPASNERYGYYRFGTAAGGSYLPQDDRNFPKFDTAESGANVNDFTILSHTIKNPAWDWELYDISLDITSVKAVGKNSTEHENNYRNQYGHRAYATSYCFPDKDAKDIVDALESGFGVRFVFTDDFSRVRIILLRNIFRSGDVQNLGGEVINVYKLENNIRGFRLTYGGGEDDTNFYHELFNHSLSSYKVKKSASTNANKYGTMDSSRSYGEIIRNVTAFDSTVYITPNTGNAYVAKVNEEAKRYKELYPSLFEDVPFIDAEDGDCSGEKSTIKEVTVGFTPLVMNDVNFPEERVGNTDTQRFCLFISDDMQPRRPQSPEPFKRKSTIRGYNMDDAANIYPTDGTYRYNTGTKDGAFEMQSDVCSRATVTYTLKHDLKTANDQLNTWKVSADLNFYFYETYRLMLQDNFEPNDDGISPIESHDWGLTFGVMRGSGNDSRVVAKADSIEDEGNYTWEVIPGSTATAHPDTCDSYGNEWNYNETVTVSTPAEAISAMYAMWPASNFNLTERDGSSYLLGMSLLYTKDDTGNSRRLLLARSTISGTLHTSSSIRTYVAQHLNGKSGADMLNEDSKRWGILIEVDSSNERMETLRTLQRIAYAATGETLKIDGGIQGVGNRFGRFSLKLRAEKPNPYFKEGDDESTRYLKIENPNLRGRGLADQFYKEYSYFIRNARIAKMKVRMELAQLLSIDKTKQVKVGDVQGFIRKMEYTVSKDSGLGDVTMEIMYI